MGLLPQQPRELPTDSHQLLAPFWHCIMSPPPKGPHPITNQLRAMNSICLRMVERPSPFVLTWDTSDDHPISRTTCNSLRLRLYHSSNSPSLPFFFPALSPVMTSRAFSNKSAHSSSNSLLFGEPSLWHYSHFSDEKIGLSSNCRKFCVEI